MGLPLFEGKTIHQFDAQYSSPKFWIDEAEGRHHLLGRFPDEGQTWPTNLSALFPRYRSATNERTLIAAILPPYSFAGNTLTTVDGDFPSQYAIPARSLE